MLNGVEHELFYKLGARLLTSHLFGNELFIRSIVHVFREHLSVDVCAPFPFGFDGGIWDFLIIVLSNESLGPKRGLNLVLLAPKKKKEKTGH